MRPRIFAALLIATIAVRSPATAHRSRVPSTGLAKIAFASAPPDFTFTSGQISTRLSAFVGKPVVVNFWATWCGPCDDELPAFAQMQKTYGNDVVFIAVSGENEDVTSAYLRARGVNALAVADADHRVFDLYGITPIPVTLVLGRDGKVEHVSVGELDWPELEAAVRAASSAEPAPAPTAS